MKKKKTKVNQQGTLKKKDSSETICAKNLKKNLNKKFINWFIGFTEGLENTFFLNRRFLRFELNVNIKNLKIIYYIRKNLGFGNIRRLRFLNTVIIEFSVQENIFDLINLVNIFNGNLRCRIKEQQFSFWYKKLEIKLKKLNLINLLPKYESSIKDISLEDSWLSGFIDSRVLFYARWHKSKKLTNGKELYLNCIFWHLSDNLLLNLKQVIQSISKVEFLTKWNLPFYKLVIDNINEKKKIKRYLDKYPLKSIKKEKYKYWKNLFELEETYIMTGNQNINLIEKKLIKFTALIKDDVELNKL